MRNIIRIRYYRINNKIKITLFELYKIIFLMGIGDWGLGIGDWAPIPNPQSPIYIY